MKKLKIDKQKLVRRIIETVVVWTLTIWFFLVCKDYAELERGYSALGAEYLAFGLGLIWYLIPDKRKEPAPSANGTSSKKEKFVTSLYHDFEEVSSNGTE